MQVPEATGIDPDKNSPFSLSAGAQGKPVAKRVIVVTPSSLTQNWAAEVQKWLGSERCKALVMQPGPGAESQVLSTSFPAHASPHACIQRLPQPVVSLRQSINPGIQFLCRHCIASQCSLEYDNRPALIKPAHHTTPELHQIHLQSLCQVLFCSTSRLSICRCVTAKQMYNSTQSPS